MNQIRGALRVMVSDELRRAGQRFVSARYISQRFKVSYQTAHRLLTELKDQGLVVRRAGSGSFISGQTKSLQSGGSNDCFLSNDLEYHPAHYHRVRQCARSRTAWLFDDRDSMGGSCSERRVDH
jgi:DNA-binding GntR family transcriptional regulator